MEESILLLKIEPVVATGGRYAGPSQEVSNSNDQNTKPFNPAEPNVARKKLDRINEYISAQEDTDWPGGSSLFFKKTTILLTRFPWPAEVAFITFLGNR